MARFLLLMLAITWLIGAAAWAGGDGSAAPPGGPATTQPLLPAVRIDREGHAVEIDAQVVNREAQWLELLVCSPGSREHEAILTSPAKPSHVHLALLAIGLQPGSPMLWRQVDGQIKVELPRGPAVRLMILYTRDGQPVRDHANQWILHQQSRQTLPENRWLFTGSQFVEIDGQSVYRADLGGTLVSLVNFGDDLLGRGTDTTNMNDESMWGCNTARIPAKGTAVVLRIEALQEAATTQPGQAAPPASPPTAPAAPTPGREP
jgi:hypothetical protein